MTEIEKLTECVGKKVRKVWYGKDEEVFIESGINKEIILTSEYHGEYDLCWFVVFKEGKEISRINVKYVESFEWEETQ